MTTVVSRQDTMTYLGEIEQVSSQMEKLASEAENQILCLPS